ncbi:DUF4864 domain-containing protein [Anianabacter salinae]|uniref:DUF4864 domain-containing protein n=1 Tax=Anianabacter salinae TaxID=2851023 RepID=UPI00225E2B74|nr:DUF4864 domain-containing protein [Anianabacter salinae]MBV0911011.1 DUF4864 domain-containing protein [Anianabacter salinae]
MTRLLLATTFAVTLACPVAAQDADIQSVITSQFDAFRADDLNGAFSHASPMIKGIFGTPERFGMMVRNGYPMVWRPAEVEFLGLRAEDGQQVQTVLVTDANGAIHILEYEMIQTDDGWQIDGVSLLRAPAPAA